MCTALRSTAFVAFLLLIFRSAVRLLTLLIVLLQTTAALLLAALASLLVLLIALIGHFWLLELSKTTHRCCHTFLFRTHPVPCPPAASRRHGLSRNGRDDRRPANDSRAGRNAQAVGESRVRVKPNLTRAEADLRIAVLTAKLKLLDGPPYTI
jgi:hypothetical protein